jgi:hypothetical protein
VTAPTPAEARPPHTGWFVEIRLNNGHWAAWSPTHDEAEARARLAQARERSPGREYRLVRETTTYTVEET